MIPHLLAVTASSSCFLGADRAVWTPSTTRSPVRRSGKSQVATLEIDARSPRSRGKDAHRRGCVKALSKSWRISIWSPAPGGQVPVMSNRPAACYAGHKDYAAVATQRWVPYFSHCWCHRSSRRRLTAVRGDLVDRRCSSDRRPCGFGVELAKSMVPSVRIWMRPASAPHDPSVVSPTEVLLRPGWVASASATPVCRGRRRSRRSLPLPALRRVYCACRCRRRWPRRAWSMLHDAPAELTVTAVGQPDGRRRPGHPATSPPSPPVLPSSRVKKARCRHRHGAAIAGRDPTAVRRRGRKRHSFHDGTIVRWSPSPAAAAIGSAGSGRWNTVAAASLVPLAGNWHRWIGLAPGGLVIASTRGTAGAARQRRRPPSSLPVPPATPPSCREASSMTPSRPGVENRSRSGLSKDTIVAPSWYRPGHGTRPLTPCCSQRVGDPDLVFTRLIVAVHRLPDRAAADADTQGAELPGSSSCRCCRRISASVGDQSLIDRPVGDVMIGADPRHPAHPAAPLPTAPMLLKMYSLRAYPRNQQRAGIDAIGVSAIVAVSPVHRRHCHELNWFEIGQQPLLALWQRLRAGVAAVGR